MRLRLTSILLLLIVTVASIAQDRDTAEYRVARVIDLGVLAGPRRTAAILSPDGDRYAWFDNHSVTLFSLPENREEARYPFGEEMSPDPDAVRWSPDGRYLAFPDHEALARFVDSDIQVLDVETGEFRNVTDDGYDGSLMTARDKPTNPVFLDVAVAWSDDGRLAFLRYPVTDSGPAAELQIGIVDPASGETGLLAEWTPAEPYISRALAWRGNAIAVGRAPAGPQSIDTGIVLIDAESGDRERVVGVSENLRAIVSLQWSADGSSLLAYNPIYRLQYVGALERAPSDGAGVIDVRNGSEVAVDDALFVMQAGFAPEGQALAYVAQSLSDPDRSGLYIAAGPGMPGALVLPILRGDAPTPRSYAPLVWASDNTIMIRDNESLEAVLVVLERR